MTGITRPCTMHTVHGPHSHMEVDPETDTNVAIRCPGIADPDDGDPDLAAAECEADWLAAEFGMSWVCGGGSPDDVAAAWAHYRPHWNGVELVGDVPPFPRPDGPRYGDPGWDEYMLALEQREGF